MRSWAVGVLSFDKDEVTSKRLCERQAKQGRKDGAISKKRRPNSDLLLHRGMEGEGLGAAFREQGRVSILELWAYKCMCCICMSVASG